MHDAGHRHIVGRRARLRSSVLRFQVRHVCKVHVYKFMPMSSVHFIIETSVQTTYNLIEQCNMVVFFCSVLCPGCRVSRRLAAAQARSAWQLMSSTLFGATNVAMCTTGMPLITSRLQFPLLVREERARARYSSRMPAMTSSCILHSAALACTSACSSLQHGQGQQSSASASFNQQCHLPACHSRCLLAGSRVRQQAIS